MNIVPLLAATAVALVSAQVLAEPVTGSSLGRSDHSTAGPITAHNDARSVEFARRPDAKTVFDVTMCRIGCAEKRSEELESCYIVYRHQGAGMSLCTSAADLNYASCRNACGDSNGGKKMSENVHQSRACEES